ncbi:MAG: dethiobiotin synthase [Sterolibacterium sp.]
MSQGIFVTGTDTGIGKTLMACALLRGFAARGLRVAGMKPVAAGMDGGNSNEDVELLKSASNVAFAERLINPYLLCEALAPHIAARHQGIVIDSQSILECFEKMRAATDLVIVEGVGGFQVPLGPQEDSARLAVLLGLPVILVVGMRLGCISHALLTQAAIQARSLPLAGWIANQIDPQMACVEENLEALKERIEAPLLGFIPYQIEPDSAIITGLLDFTKFMDLPNFSKHAELS